MKNYQQHNILPWRTTTKTEVEKTRKIRPGKQPILRRTCDITEWHFQKYVFCCWKDCTLPWFLSGLGCPFLNKTRNSDHQLLSKTVFTFSIILRLCRETPVCHILKVVLNTSCKPVLEQQGETLAGPEPLNTAAGALLTISSQCLSKLGLSATTKF